jgi:hypothetical protein
MPVMTAPSPTLESLATGLAGAIGCSYRRGHNDLIFVEFGGKLSKLNLVRPVLATVSSGTATLHGTWTFDLDTGTEGSSGGDIWWEQHTATVRSMEPIGGAKIVNVGVVSITSVTAAILQNLVYGTTGINGNNDPTNVLVPGDVFAVKTNGGNYARVKIVSYGYDLQIQWTTYQLAPAYQVLGTGYTQPEDVQVTEDERYAYITERTGDIVRVDLNAANKNRAAATVLHAGMTAPHQIFLDEAHGHAYVVEFAPLGHLLRIELASGTTTPVLSNLQSPIGLLLTSDLRFAYVSEQLPTGKGQLVRIELATGRREILASSSTAPYFFLRFGDESESTILMTERDPANEVWLVDLTHAPPTVDAVAVGVPFRPSSIAVIAPNDLLCCSDSVIDEIELGADSIYRASGDTLLGIGFVPATAIVGGYATTDPGYFFQVKDSPFGGTLPMMVNHDKAYAEGGRYYKVFVDGVEVHTAWSDYKWDNATSKFVVTPAKLSATGFFSVRAPTELWYNHFLGYFVDTSGLTNAGHTLEVRVYTSQSAAAELMSLRDTLVVRIDNRLPSAIINQIYNDGTAVNTCAVVVGTDTLYEFDITASDPDGHLKSWSLGAMWGDNEYDTVASDTYSNHLAGAPIWGGISGVKVPTGSHWDADKGTFASTHCAHLFYLDVWDRVINGWNFIHEATYHKSITIMKP